MMRHKFKRLELVPFAEGTTRNIPLPRDRNIKRINLQFNGLVTLTDPGAGVDGVANEDAALLLAPRIEIIGDGVTSLFRHSARLAYHRNYFEHNCPPSLVGPTAAGAAIVADPVSFNIDINFANTMGVNPADTFLPAYKFKSLELYITWGTLAGMFVVTNTHVKTIDAAAGIRPVVFESSKPVEAPKTVRIQDMIERQVTATTTDFDFELAVGARGYQQLFFMALDDGVKSNAIINLLDVITGNSDYHVNKIPYLQMRNINEQDFRLETVPTGCVQIPLTEDGMLTSALGVKDVNDARARLDVTVGAGVTQIFAATDYIMSAPWNAS